MGQGVPRKEALGAPPAARLGEELREQPATGRKVREPHPRGAGRGDAGRSPAGLGGRMRDVAPRAAAGGRGPGHREGSRPDRNEVVLKRAAGVMQNRAL